MKFMDGEFTAYVVATVLIVWFSNSFPFQLIAVLTCFSIIVLRSIEDYWVVEKKKREDKKCKK